MKKLMITAMCLATAGHVFAQEEVLATGEGGVPAGLTVGADGGTAAVEAAQDAGPAPAARKFKNAKKVLSELADEKGWEEKWDEEKGRIITIAAADFTSKDPAHDKDFFAKREMAIKRAILEGKAAIIEMINTEMSASEKLDMPGTDVNRELGAEAEKIRMAMASQQILLADLLEQTDRAEAEMLRGTTFGQRLDDLMAAAIKRLDAEYDAGKHDEAAKSRYVALKAQCVAALREFDALKEKAEKLQESIQSKQESSVATMARMPLYGSTVIMQTESWDDRSEKYQVAVILTWSKTLERAVRAIVTGEDYKTKPGKKSVQKWLKGQDVATMLGPRQYIDDKGDRWFLGVTARAYNDNMPSALRNKNKGLAEMFAKQMAAFCVFADVESYKRAQQAMETRGNETESTDTVAESYAQALSQSFAKKTIRGMQKLGGIETTHPITGDEIYVAIFGLNASSAAAALEVEKINYATKIMDNQHQTVERGRRSANAAAVKASENRPEDFQKGFNAQTGAVVQELEKRANDGKPKGTAIINTNQGIVSPRTNKKNTSGTFSGDVDVGDDF